MRTTKLLTMLLCLAVSIFVAGATAQDPAPEMPFKTVHLLSLGAVQEATLRDALADLNRAMAKAGFPKARYRLYKVHGKQQGKYGHLLEATWAGRAEYDKIHDHPEYKAARARHNLGDILKDRIYNRLVEIPANK